MTAADILGVLLRTNLAAGGAILGVIALRKLVRPRFGARLAYGLWLLPVLAGLAVMLPAREVLVVRSAAPAVVMAASVHRTILSPPPGAVASLDIPLLLVGLWLAGVAGAALIMVRLQRRFLRQARAGEVGPAVIGVISPRVVTPSDFGARYSPGEQALVLAHEQAHIARHDSRLNGLSAAAQCLCWFNPLVHLGAHLMRIDQELACDEAVVARFPGARRAYAEVLMKAQLAILPLPLGCYWPSKTAHPLVERVAMLKRKDIGRARRIAGAATLALLGSGAGLAAWASQPADVRIAIGPVPPSAQAGVIAPKSDRMAAAGYLGAQTPDPGAVAPEAVTAADAPAASDGAETDAASDTSAMEPRRRDETVKVVQVALAPAANIELLKASLIPVADVRMPEANSPLGPGHYVESSGLKSSSGCGTPGPTYKFSTPRIAQGHVITNFHFELVGDSRCKTKWPGDTATALCELSADRPDKKTVEFQLLPNGNNCFFYSGISAGEYPSGISGAADLGAVTQSEMVLSFDVQ